MVTDFYSVYSAEISWPTKLSDTFVLYSLGANAPKVVCQLDCD